jgi:hypothetical protein
MTRVVPTLLAVKRLTVLSAAVTFAAFGAANSQAGISTLEQPDSAAPGFQSPSSTLAVNADEFEYTNRFGGAMSAKAIGDLNSGNGMPAPSMPSGPGFSDIARSTPPGPFQVTTPSFVGTDILPGAQDEADGSAGFGGATSTRTGGASAIPSPSAVMSGLSGFGALALLSIAKRVRRAIRSYQRA